MNVDHKLVHAMIAGLSLTREGRTLVENLEELRYYHRYGKSFYLGDGARLIVSYNESPEYMEDNKIVGALYLPGNHNGKPGHENLFIDEACHLGDKVEAALYWSFPKDMDEVWEPIMNRPEYRGASCINTGYIVQQLMSTAHAPTLVPYELAAWAAEIIVDISEWDEITVDQCRPVWREVIVKYPGDDDTFIRTLIKVPSEELDLYLTTLDENLDRVRTIPVTSNDPRILFARKVNQERRVLTLMKFYQNRVYFGNLSTIQALAHLVMDDYRPHDIEF